VSEPAKVLDLIEFAALQTFVTLDPLLQLNTSACRAGAGESPREFELVTILVANTIADSEARRVRIEFHPVSMPNGKLLHPR